MSETKQTVNNKSDENNQKSSEHQPIWLQLTVGYQMDGSWIRVDDVDDPAVRMLIEQGYLKMDR